MTDSSRESSVVAGRHEQTYIPACKTRNWPTYNEALKRRGSLTIRFDPEMIWDGQPTGKRGRKPDQSDGAIQTCLTMKVLFGMAPTAGGVSVRAVGRRGGTGTLSCMGSISQTSGTAML